jgi:stage III sporulation protein AD
MEEILQIAALAGVAAVLALLLQRENPAIAFCVVVMAVVGILWRFVSLWQPVQASLRTLLAQSGLQSAVYAPVVKTVGVGLTVRIAGALCRDSGQGALAAVLEITGTAAAIFCCLPLFEQVLTFAGQLLGQ